MLSSRILPHPLPTLQEQEIPRAIQHWDPHTRLQRNRREPLDIITVVYTQSTMASHRLHVISMQPPQAAPARCMLHFRTTVPGYVGTPAYNWSVSPSTGVIGNTSTSAYPTMAFTQNGNFSVTHCISSGGRSDCETKTDYIWVYNSTATATTTFWAVDPSGHRVYDSAISLQDVENTSWTNTSSPSGGVATITSLIGHTINGYATAAGYNDGETLGITADGVTGGIILMTPTNITNVSAGYVTLYVYVKEAVGNAPVSGAYVNIAYASGGSTVNDGGTTSTDGIASFTVPNKTLDLCVRRESGIQPGINHKGFRYRIWW